MLHTIDLIKSQYRAFHGTDLPTTDESDPVIYNGTAIDFKVLKDWTDNSSAENLLQERGPSKTEISGLRFVTYKKRPCWLFESPHGNLVLDPTLKSAVKTTATLENRLVLPGEIDLFKATYSAENIPSEETCFIFQGEATLPHDTSHHFCVSSEGKSDILRVTMWLFKGQPYPIPSSWIV